MKKLLSISLLTLALLFSLPSQALSPSEQRYIDLLASGGPVSIRNVAKSIYNTGENNQQVLDTLTEVLLENQQTTNKTYIDAMSWASKALGNSGNARYRDALNEVAENGGHKKLRKYAEKALKQLDNNKVEQYKKGLISLSSLSNSDTGKAVKSTAASTPIKNTTQQPITIIKAGMGMQEVYDLVGHPTATTSHQTGKAWIPFNFKGADNVRTIALYKGQGRVVFSNESSFSSGWRVKEVQLNENESGYP